MMSEHPLIASSAAAFLWWSEIHPSLAHEFMLGSVFAPYADNISGCIELLKEMDWDGVLSIECEAAPGKVEQSLEWLRGQISR